MNWNYGLAYLFYLESRLNKLLETENVGFKKFENVGFKKLENKIYI